MKLNLGCSTDVRYGYENVDRVPPADQIVNLAEPWPWPHSPRDAVPGVLAGNDPAFAWMIGTKYRHMAGSR